MEISRSGIYQPKEKKSLPRLPFQAEMTEKTALFFACFDGLSTCFSGLLFDAPFLSVAGEKFPGDPNGSVFDGRPIA